MMTKSIIPPDIIVEDLEKQQAKRSGISSQTLPILTKQQL